MTREPIILVVEDNDDDAELTLMAFRDAKIRNPLVRAEDGVQALDYLLCRGRHAARDVTDLPAVVLLDLKLPRMSGLEVLAALRADGRTRHLPVVVLTSSREDKDRLAAYSHFVNSYIQKPVDFDKFRETVKQLGLYWLVVNQAAPAERS